ncbi:hypothetical protein KJF94_04580 [Pseudomonas hormoni]|uniref:AFP-like domain-containing protein n=1 Tax=Pseudomonas hormoni TaxID=3093767 RepID=A0ABX8F7B2_9PSED|nr:hypothetical protein KJF94_04580 [Pseudomonas hormoni]
MLGAGAIRRTDAWRKSLVYRRSLYVTHGIAAGEPCTVGNLLAIRPGLGLAPKHAETLPGRRARQAIKRGTPLDWSLVE